MTHKQRVLATRRGQVPDRIPWISRLDLWHDARSQAGNRVSQMVERYR
jgi:hypothetical protein